MIQRILKQAPASVEDLAADAGLSPHTLWSWAAGRRNPSPENLEKLAVALRRRGGELVELAEELTE